MLFLPTHPSQDFTDTRELLSPRNIDREMLCDYALEAADWSTELPRLDFAVSTIPDPRLTPVWIALCADTYNSTINLDHTGWVVANIFPGTSFD